MSKTTRYTYIPRYIICHLEKKLSVKVVKVIISLLLIRYKLQLILKFEFCFE